MFRSFLSFLLAFSFTLPVMAHHGPGSTGGGLSVLSAETLPQGEVSISYRADYTKYEDLSGAEIEAKTLAIGAAHVHLDVVRESFLQSFGIAFGVTDLLQLEIELLGQYRAVAVAEGHTHGLPDDYGFHSFGDISGQTDTWVTGKLQVLQGEVGKLALIGGVKLPTGRTDARSQEPPSTTNARILDLSLQPGSGSFDGSFGLAFTSALGGDLSLDVDSRYTSRGSHESFRAGDRLDAGAALGWRFLRMEDGSFGMGGFLETNLVNLDRNQEEEDGVWEDEDNTGGLTLFVAPGLKATAGKNFSAALSFQVPVVQSLNSEQQKTDYKASVSMSMSF